MYSTRFVNLIAWRLRIAFQEISNEYCTVRVHKSTEYRRTTNLLRVKRIACVLVLWSGVRAGAYVRMSMSWQSTCPDFPCPARTCRTGQSPVWPSTLYMNLDTFTRIYGAPLFIRVSSNVHNSRKCQVYDHRNNLYEFSQSKMGKLSKFQTYQTFAKRQLYLSPAWLQLKKADAEQDAFAAVNSACVSAWLLPIRHSPPTVLVHYYTPTHEGSNSTTNSNGKNILYNSEGHVVIVISLLVKYYELLAHYNKVIKLLSLNISIGKRNREHNRMRFQQ